MFSINDLLKLADNDCTEAMVMLGSYFYNGSNGVSEDKKRSFEFLKKAADLYDPDAQMLISEFYLKGIAVNKDVERSKEYCINSINQDNILAKWKLASYYESIKEYDEAAELLKDDRFERSPIVKLHLSMDLYRSGDYEGAYKALDRFYKSEPRQTILRGYCLIKGQGTNAYPEDGIRVLNKIKANDPSVGYIIGMYEGSLENTMLKDYKESSLIHMEESAKMDFIPAIYEVGVRFRDGIGIEADVDKGKSYILKATLRGYDGKEEYNPFFDDDYYISEEVEYSNVIRRVAEGCEAVLNRRAQVINPKLSEQEKLVRAAIGIAASNIIYGEKQ